MYKIDHLILWDEKWIVNNHSRIKSPFFITAWTSADKFMCDIPTEWTLYAYLLFFLLFLYILCLILVVTCILSRLNKSVIHSNSLVHCWERLVCDVILFILMFFLLLFLILFLVSYLFFVVLLLHFSWDDMLFTFTHNLKTHHLAYQFVHLVVLNFTLII